MTTTSMNGTVRRNAPFGLMLSPMVCVLPYYLMVVCCESFSVSTPLFVNTRRNSPFSVEFLFLELQYRRQPSLVRLAAPRTGGASAAESNVNDVSSFLDETDDPFQILQMPAPSSDSKEIRKAYRRMAVRFHPDVITNKDSSAAAKKLASDRFAKINWAYQTLSSGKSSAGPAPASSSSSNRSSKSSSTSSSSTSSSSSSGWTPPHRRASSSSSSSTDWRDYMPNFGQDYEDNSSKYDAGGDSFGQIFSDLFRTAAAGAVGGGGILKDFVEFLETEAGSAASKFATGSASSSSPFGTSSYYDSSSSTVDAELLVLLQTGTVEQIAEEMDDATLVEQQLETKLSNLLSDAASLQADLKLLLTTTTTALSTTFQQRESLQEELAAVQARIPVVQQYLKQARKRLLALQTRYKELIVNNKKDDTPASSAWDDIRREAQSSSSRRGGATTDASSTQQQQRAKSSSSSGGEQDDDDAWKSDSFGSSGRRRSRSGRSRGAASSKTSTDSSDSTSSYSQQQQQQQQQRPTSTSASTSSTSSSASSQPQSYGQQQRTSPSSSSSSQSAAAAGQDNTSIPPHRQQRSSYSTSYQEDKRRLRELKVDEEFEKLKKELGL